MKETKLQRDVRLLRAQIARLEMQRNGALAALVNAEIKLPGLRKNLERLRLRLASKLRNVPLPDAGIADNPLPAPAEHVADNGGGADDDAVLEDNASGEPLARQDESGIPEFLRRTALQGDVAQAAYAVANAHNKTPTPEQKKLVTQEKRRVKEERRDATLTGKTRKWPATGRDARALLNRGG